MINAAATAAGVPDPSTRRWPIDAARGVFFFLSLVLLYTGFAKLTDPSRFADILRAQGLLPAGATTVAWLTPLSELLVAVVTVYALATRSPRLRFAASAQAALFFVFTVYCAALWADPPRTHVPCGCGFSKSLVLDWSGPTIRAGVLAMLAAISTAVLHTSGRRR